MSFSVTQAAKAVNVSVSTIRHWGNLFTDHLSDLAKPAAGERRQYNEEDLAILQTVKVMRDQRYPFPEIEKVITKGDRFELVQSDSKSAPKSPKTAPDTPEQVETEVTHALARVDLLERFVSRYENKIDTLENQLIEEREARLKAETEAANLAGKIEVIESKLTGFWRRLFGRD